jgi:iron(III) transport system ATP-binding protein
MTLLQVRHLTKRFTNSGYPAVEDVSFELERGEILALVGPSGCGKTTTLRLIAGLERPGAGHIWLDGRLLASESVLVPPEQRGVGMVFQDYALFPHLTVFENVAFGLQRLPAAEKRARVGELLNLVEMEALASRFPHQLSGGERQRAALVRALAPQPALLLLDEPFSSLDADRRREVRQQVRSLLKSLQATAIFVTHDQEEALSLGDRLAVFHRGRLEQIGAPDQVFHASATRFVAEFMGGSDFLPGQVTPQGILTELGLLPQAQGANGHSRVEVTLRADDVDFSLAEPGNAVIEARTFQGAFQVYRLRLDSGLALHSIQEHTVLLPTGARARVFIRAAHPLVVFPQKMAEGVEKINRKDAKSRSL